MRTTIISDLHLGVRTGADVARRPEDLERLLAALEGADRLVLLGDVVELREQPLASVLDTARPVFEALGARLAGGRVVIVPGNHDHLLAEPWLGRMRLEGTHPGSEQEWRVAPGDGAAGRLASFMPRAEITLAYPGLRLRPDVYAVHGHYLDLHLTVPRLESVAAAVMGRLTGRGRMCRTAAEYEAVLSPLYSFFTSLAQGSASPTMARGASLSRSVWQQVNGGTPARASLPHRARAALLGRLTIPGAVLALNGLGLGPFNSELTGEELRRSGLAAMGRVADDLAPGATHVMFGHTHRPGPLPGDDLTEWTTLAGARLWNTGSWFHEGVLMGEAAERSPYWPGTVATLDDQGPPSLVNVLGGRAAGGRSGYAATDSGSRLGDPST